MYKICHSEESARRQRALEQGLLVAMSRLPYTKITLTGLCRELNVPRKTFYRYFPTKEDCLLGLIDHTLSDCNGNALACWSKNGRLDQKVQLQFFEFWMENRVFLDAMERNGFHSLLLDRTTVIVDRMKENAQRESFATDQVEYFVAHGLMTTVLRWHHFGFPSTPAEMAEVFGSLLGVTDVAMSKLLL